ncbi:MAG: hypothetical protein HQ596_01845 [Candidatus Saganbacteria bacterium]|nr:hypothetical protein [Candidatus Saganbacteria bacterium]
MKKTCKNCEKVIANLEESYLHEGHVICERCKSILDRESTCLPSSTQKSCNGIPRERKPVKKIGYIKKHWRGELSLAVSFWVNLCLLNCVIIFVGKLLSYGEVIKNPVNAARFVLIHAVFALLIVYPWQIVGLWRACNQYIKTNGKRFWANAAQVIVVIGLIATFARLNVLLPVYKDYFRLGFGVAENKKYTIKLEKNNTLIYLQGDLTFGVSKDAAKLLRKYPEIESIILDSIGGRIYEGRELAKLISTYSLDTYSFNGCYSAATTAFISGKKRFLGMGANLAFHQYKSYYENLGAYVNTEAEQAKDLMIFQEQGIKSDFLDKLFNAPHNDLWYPTVDEMLAAGVIHGIVNPSDLLPEKQVFSSKELEEALDVPIYKAIQKHEPKTYRKIKVEFEKLNKKGATFIEFQRAGAKFLQPLVNKLMPKSSNEALIQFAQAMVDRIIKFKETDPILCMKMLYPQRYGDLDLTNIFSDNEIESMINSISRVIIDAYEKNNLVVDMKSAKLLSEKLSPKIKEYADYIELDSLHTTDDFERHCDFLITAYTLILKEDKITASNALRYMLSQE